MVDVEKQIKALNRQLYPTGRAWAYVHGAEVQSEKTIQFIDNLGNRFVDNLGNPFVQIIPGDSSDSRKFINAMLKSYERAYIDLRSLLNQTVADNEGFDAIDASNWERVFGLSNNGLSIEDRRANILRRQSYPAGVAERGHYLLIQDELQKAGFDVYVHENRFPDGAGNWEVQNPDNTGPQLEQFGLTEFGIGELGGEISGLDYTICANYIEESLDATFFEEESGLNQFGESEFGVGELETTTSVNIDIQLRVTFFVGGEIYPSSATVPLDRKNEFRQLILKLKPAHTIAFLYINYV